MSISHAHPLFLLLLVSIFFLPAVLGGTNFRTCNGSYENYRVNVETVKISPLPITGISNADITITGYTASIPNGAIVELTIAEASAGDPITSSIKTYNLCDIVRCPIRPGRFSFTLSKIFSNKELKGRIYAVTVGIKKEKDTMMCVVFLCWITEGGSAFLNRQPGTIMELA
ncbi:MD-2-related lipid recognition domain-containing protein [Raphanus sativus]|uniref:MD-2-related lipid-recognition protein ROSY1-like n=1 Tax=Raphanus sativus TaxID=3726 RepID=A0A6J0P0J9_RAPSA|nr:MD-2-related lipid-recognition protein ROSY1-like [Raphanus sativus]KAJ4897936.1 MD-2-related lipid recognition domain-containing protein [Raphanus sativus]